MKSVKTRNSKKISNKNRKYKSIKNNTAYQFSSKTQTLGVGKTSVRVTRFYTLTEQLSYMDFIIEFMDDSVSSPEFVRMATDYTYAKLKLVTITISPRQITTTTMNFIKIDWFNSDPTDVRYDDNAKLIYTNTTYPKIYRIKPPNVLLNIGSRFYNYNEWLIANSIKNLTMPGFLKITSMPEFTIQIETKWVFRGLNSVAPSSKVIKIQPKRSHADEVDEAIFELKKIAHKIDKIEEKEEEEEEENEEIDKKEQIEKEEVKNKEINKHKTESKSKSKSKSKTKNRTEEH